MLVFQMKFVACLKNDIGTKDDLVSLFMNLFVNLRISKVGRVLDVLWHVGNKAHIFNIIEDGIVLLTSIFFSDW